jgi:hypothetical protein
VMCPIRVSDTKNVVMGLRQGLSHSRDAPGAHGGRSRRRSSEVKQGIGLVRSNSYLLNYVTSHAPSGPDLRSVKFLVRGSATGRLSYVLQKAETKSGQ